MNDVKIFASIVDDATKRQVEEAADDCKGGLMMTKPILDVCCGGKMFYFDKNDPRVVFRYGLALFITDNSRNIVKQDKKEKED